MPGKVYAYAEGSDVAKSVGRYILYEQDNALSSSLTFDIAISGGSLGKVLKAALVEDPVLLKKVQWDKWQVFFSDERLVPLDHPDSNYGLFNHMVLSNLPANSPKPKVFHIDTTLLTGKDGQVKGSDFSKDEEIARKYESILPQGGKLDLVLLGCGPDGHTCSLFPGHRLLQETSRLDAALNDSEKPPSRRITITLPVLQKANAIAFVAEGSGKAPILKEIFENDNSKLPAKIVADLKKGANVSWFVDNSALNGVNIVTSKY